MDVNSLQVQNQIDQFAVPETTRTAQKELGQNDFLTLMMTQLKAQDPLSPQDSSQFLAQMAQFGTVEGINKLQSSFEGFSSTLVSNQALQAASLVGRKVQVNSQIGLLKSGEGLSGAVQLQGNTDNIVVNIHDMQGNLVKRLDLGSGTEGLKEFKWDGTTTQGQPATPGKYHLVAEGRYQNTVGALATNATLTVDSVSLGDNQSTLKINFNDLGTVNFNDVIKVY